MRLVFYTKSIMKSKFTTTIGKISYFIFNNNSVTINVSNNEDIVVQDFADLTNKAHS